MQQLSKIVTRQDANYKLSPSSSNETSINLSKEISALISDESDDVTFTLYKSDFIKALSALCLIPQLYQRKDQDPTPIRDIFSFLSKQIVAEFGNSDIATYTVYHFKRDDGRSYFNNLKQPNGFNLRSFLVEQNSILTFIKNDSGSLTIRLKTIVPEEKGQEKDLNIVEEHIIDDNEPLQQIFYGAPGTGKSFAIDNLTNDENTVRTTFHPDSDYASFVGAYKPTMEDVPINSIYGESVQYATGKNGHPGTEKKIVYKYVPQAFLKAYVAAWSDLDNPHYLVIEEINRGNCAQIFGDLFQLLDRNSHGSSSYAIHADDDIRQFLATDSKGFGNLSEEQKQAIADFVLVKDNGKRSVIGPKILSGELLLLPPNLRIWATMNTSDQSLFPIDSAFKRRWNWHYVPIEYNKKYWLLHIGDNYYRWGDFLKAINPIISELTESADKQMGYFFAKPDEKHGVTTENNTISEDVFINKVLFYLWTDVLKDFDAGKEPFMNPDTKRAYEFSDFFDAGHDYLEQFVGKLGLEAVDIDFDSIPDDDSDEDETTSADATQRDHSRYSINGEGKYNKRQTVLRALRKYVEANPSMTSEEIIENWKSVNPEIPYFILSASEYETRIQEYPAQRDRYWSVKTGTEEKVYITNQWGAGRIAEFINLINNSNFGLHIEKVTE